MTVSYEERHKRAMDAAWKKLGSNLNPGDIAALAIREFGGRELCEEVERATSERDSQYSTNIRLLEENDSLRASLQAATSLLRQAENQLMGVRHQSPSLMEVWKRILIFHALSTEADSGVQK